MHVLRLHRSRIIMGGCIVGVGAGVVGIMVVGIMVVGYGGDSGGGGERLLFEYWIK